MTSEKTLVVVAIIAVIVSAMAMVFSIVTSGNVNDWVLGLSPGATVNQSIGVVNVTIVQNLVVNFTMDKIIWGQGFVNAGEVNASLDSAQSISSVRGTWNRLTGVGGDGAPTPRGFELQNIGNINATLYLKSDKTAAQFIGGIAGGGPMYRFNVSNQEAGSCLTAAGGAGMNNLNNYIDVNLTHPGTPACERLRFGPSGSGGTPNTIRIDVLLQIPNDATPGTVAKTSNITATAEIAP